MDVNMNHVAYFYQQQVEFESSIALAQRLNDRGAKLLGCGEYEEAINMLVQALKLWEQVAEDETCSCRHCALEECIIKTLPDSSPLQQHSSLKYTFCQPVGSEEQSCQDLDSEDRFIYKRPIYASPKFTEKGHSPGITLSLIIILKNLARNPTKPLSATTSESASALRASTSTTTRRRDLQPTGNHNHRQQRWWDPPCSPQLQQARHVSAALAQYDDVHDRLQDPRQFERIGRFLLKHITTYPSQCVHERSLKESTDSQGKHWEGL